MHTIYKYQLPFADSFSVPLPMGASIVSFGNQNEIPTIWAIVNKNAVKNDLIKPRKFRMAGTGHDINCADLLYIGTAHFQRSSLIFHLFEDKSEDIA